MGSEMLLTHISLATFGRLAWLVVVEAQANILTHSPPLPLSAVASQLPT